MKEDMKDMTEEIIDLCEYLKSRSVSLHQLARGIKLTLEMLDSGTLSGFQKTDLQDFLYETLALIDERSDADYNFADKVQVKYSNPKTA